MEGEIENVEIKHCNSHRHPLILKEHYHAEGDFVCDHCEKPILCKTSVYTCDAQNYKSCASFFLHKNCADLPITFIHPNHDHILVNTHCQYIFLERSCSVCQNYIYRYKHIYSYECKTCEFRLCLKCVVTPIQETIIHHWSHPHSPLRIVERCAMFECDACNTVATEFSYRCDDTTCSFWIHQTCATLPQFKLFKIHHKHPLQISDSMPQVYSSFRQYCKICKKDMQRDQWLYYCARCRFFAHIRCALSTTPVLREIVGNDDEKLTHLPAPDERSMNCIMQKWIKDTVSRSVDITLSPPYHITHWAHMQHPLTLKNKSDIFIIDEELNQVSEKLIICDGCTKPISSSDDADVFYECSECTFSLHRYCAQFPQTIDQREHEAIFQGFQPSSFLDNIRCCRKCDVYSNGLKFKEYRRYNMWCIWCVCLPEKIIHKAHHHPLKKCYGIQNPCKGCGWKYYNFVGMECESCKFVLHRNCLMPAATINHRWDPHPLHLVLSIEEDVEDDHPHNFECEYCSKVINTNYCFYHCSICDLSFHNNRCIHPFGKSAGHRYSNIKFGATNIKKEAHEHNLTFVLNKKNVPCTICNSNTKNHPVLLCKPCKFIQHLDH